MIDQYLSFNSSIFTNKFQFTVLGDRRLPQTLVRLIEPFVSRTTDANGGDMKGAKPVEPLSYVEKAALSMVLFLREACVNGASELRFQLSIVSTGGCVAGRQDEMWSPPPRADRGNPAFTGMGKGQNTPSVLQAVTPSSPRSRTPFGRNLDGEFESGRRGEDSEANTSDSHTADEHGDGGKGFDESGVKTLSIVRLLSAAATLRAAAGMASQPSLRRLMVAGGDEETKGSRGDIGFIRILSDILTVLPTSRAAASAISSTQSGSEVFDAVVQAEQAAIVALEIIAQIDTTSDFGHKSSGARSFFETVARTLLPAVANLSAHPGTVRHVMLITLLLQQLYLCPGHDIPTVLRDRSGYHIRFHDKLSTYVSHCIMLPAVALNTVLVTIAYQIIVPQQLLCHMS